MRLLFRKKSKSQTGNTVIEALPLLSLKAEHFKIHFHTEYETKDEIQILH